MTISPPSADAVKRYWYRSQTTPMFEIEYVCAADFDALTTRLARAEEERDALRTGLKKLDRAYVLLLECARDQIIALGGTCDSVEQMERGDTHLADARALAASKGTGK